MIIHISFKLPLYVFHMVSVWQTIFGKDVHEFEEIVLNFVRVLLFVVRLVKCHDAVTTLSTCDQAQTALKYLLEDDLANCGFLFHVFFDQLDQKLVDELLNMGWCVAQVRWLNEMNDATERLQVANDPVLRLSIISNKLPQYNDHIVVDLDCEIHVADARAMQNFKQ